MTTAAPGQAASLGSRVKERLRQLWPHELPFGHLHRDQDGIPVRMPEAGYGRSRTTHLSVSRLGIDAALLWVIVGLLLWGMVMVYSASIAMPDNPRFANYTSTHFLSRHMFSLLMGTVAALLAFQVPMSVWEKWAPWLFLVSILLLVAVPFLLLIWNIFISWFFTSSAGAVTMESYPVRAPYDGYVASVLCGSGAEVSADAPVIVMKRTAKGISSQLLPPREPRSSR